MAEQVALYKIPESREVARILDDSVLPAYNDLIKVYKSEKAKGTLSKFNSVDGALAGSSPFMLVQLANSGLLPSGARLATRKDLETAISFDNSFLTGNFVDFGLALRTAGDSYEPNDLLAKRLTEQLKHRGINLDGGKLIPLAALDLLQDDDSAYGLIFGLKDGAEKLVEDLDAYKWNYTGKEGLACADLGGGWGWGSSGVHLADSSGVGRVVVVSAEGTSQKFLDEQLAELQEIRDEKIANIQKRYKQAEAILRGE